MADEKNAKDSLFSEEEMLKAIEIDKQMNAFHEKVKKGLLTPEEKELLEFMSFKEENFLY